MDMLNEEMVFVDEITPEMKGRFLITTQGSEHYWNTEEDFYIRNPKDESKGVGFSHGFNNIEQYWDEVLQYPAVDDCFITKVGCHIHRSSLIKSIQVFS